MGTTVVLVVDVLDELEVVAAADVLSVINTPGTLSCYFDARAT